MLIGDAAHLIHPMAGQGMNASIADGWTLFRTIAERDGFRSPAALDAALAAYGRLRRAELRVIDRISHRLSLLCTATSGVGGRLSRRVLLHNRDNERLLGLATAAMAGVPGERFTPLRWLQVLPAPERRVRGTSAPRASWRGARSPLRRWCWLLGAHLLPFAMKGTGPGGTAAPQPPSLELRTLGPGPLASCRRRRGSTFAHLHAVQLRASRAPDAA